MARSLLTYVQDGGILVSFARVGTLDECGWYQPDLPIPELGRAFGINRIEADTLGNHKITMAGRSYDGWLNRDLLALEEGTEILGSFDDGHPAVTLAKVGKGFGVYIATQADGSLAKTGNTLLPDVIAKIAARAGFKPQLRVDYKEKKGREIDPHLLDTPGRTEILLVSYLNKPAQVALRLVETNRSVECVRAGILEKVPLAFSEVDGEFLSSIGMEPRGATCIEIVWK